MLSQCQGRYVIFHTLSELVGFGRWIKLVADYNKHKYALALADSDSTNPNKRISVLCTTIRY
jgi:hypothetical protein